MKIKKIALIGAGAVGSYFVQGLMKKNDIEFCVVAEGSRADRMKANGLRINGKTLFPEIKKPAEAHGADLILIAVKYDAIHEAARMAYEIVAEQTIILSLLNGLDSEEIVGKAAGMEHLMYSIMRIQSWRDNGEIRFLPERTAGLFFGETDRAEKNASEIVATGSGSASNGSNEKEDESKNTNGSDSGRMNNSEKTDRVLAVEELFKDTEIRCTFVPDMKTEMWIKYAANISRNLPQAILGVGFGAYEDSAHVAYIRDVMDAEVRAVAEAKGVRIPKATPGTSAAWSECSKDARFSTLQDLDAKRHTEIEMFLGSLIRIAEEVSVPIPACTLAYHIIKAMEEKNDGLFDY